MSFTKTIAKRSGPKHVRYISHYTRQHCYKDVSSSAQRECRALAPQAPHQTPEKIVPWFTLTLLSTLKPSGSAAHNTRCDNNAHAAVTVAQSVSIRAHDRRTTGALHPCSRSRRLARLRRVRQRRQHIHQIAETTTNRRTATTQALRNVRGTRHRRRCATIADDERHRGDRGRRRGRPGVSVGPAAPLH